MFSKKSLTSAILVLEIVFAAAFFIGISGNIATAQVPEELFTDPVLNSCGDNADFTTDFPIDMCKFKTIGYNPYFILLPGWQFILENEDEDEREVVTVLYEKETINLDGRKIKTRVVEERALEWEEGENDEEDKWITVEISKNWIAICDKTNDVYYFGEDSQDCDLEERGGFDPEDESKCADDSEPDTGGSWEAGEPPEDQEYPIAQPGMLMPGVYLLGAKYFQEIAVNLVEQEESAIDRGEHVAMTADELEDWPDCVKVIDTNPTEDECGEDDAKIYCPGMGIVQDQDLVRVDQGFVNKKGKPIKKKLNIK